MKTATLKIAPSDKQMLALQKYGEKSRDSEKHVHLHASNTFVYKYMHLLNMPV